MTDRIAKLPATRVCKKCKIEKPIMDFPAYHKTDGQTHGVVFHGRRHVCTQCEFQKKQPLVHSDVRLHKKLAAERVRDNPPVVEGPTPIPAERTPVMYGYVRVSTMIQVKEGKSLEEQTERITKFYGYWGHEKGILWGDIYRDAGVSAHKKRFAQREAGSVLAARLLPGDHVVMTSLDRGFRNFKDAINTFETWLDKGIFLHLLDFGVSTDNHIGRMILRILSVTAQFQRDMISEYIKNTLDMQCRQGRLMMRYTDIGWKIEGEKGQRVYVPDEEERSACLLIAHLYDTEHWSFQQIAELLRERKTPQTRGLKRPTLFKRKAAPGEPPPEPEWTAEAATRAYTLFRRNPSFRQEKFLRSQGFDPDTFDPSAQEVMVDGRRMLLWH